MVLLLIAIFLFILFIVAVALSAKSWRAWHIVAAVLTYLAAFGLLVLASYTVKTHGYWKSEYSKAKTSLETAQKQGVELEWGDPLLVESPTPTVNDALAQNREKTAPVSSYSRIGPVLQRRSKRALQAAIILSIDVNAKPAHV